MTARDEILASVRRSLHVSGDEAPRRAAVAARLAQAPIGVVPARGQGDAAARIATFKAEAARAAATIADVASAADVPAEIARYLREGNMPATLRMGADARLAAMPWAATTLEISHGPPTATTSTPSARPSPPSPRPARWRSSPAPTIRRRSISCPTITSRSFSPRTSSAISRACSRGCAPLWRGRCPANAEFHHRPVAVGRHRADAAVRRARPAAAAYRDGRGGLRRARRAKAMARLSPLLLVRSAVSRPR